MQNGDRLTRDEFERRFDATPNLKKAELIEGVVYTAPPVSHVAHSRPHSHLIGWLTFYESFTPGVQAGDNGSVRLATDVMLQPDAYLFLPPSHGGQSRVSGDDYVEGAPEFVAEVAASSASYDLHNKLDVYRRSGVREYLVWRVYDGAIDWFVLRNGEYERLNAGPDGVVKSQIFPGLWLDPAALLRGDMASVLQTAQAGLAAPEHATYVVELNRRAGTSS